MPLRTSTSATAALHQAMAIEHRMDGAFGGDGDIRRTRGASALEFCEHPSWGARASRSEGILYLERELIGVSIGTPAPVRQALHSAFLITIEDLVTGLAGDPELPAKFRHRSRRLAGEPPTAAFRPSPNTPSKASLPPLWGESVTHVSGTMCYLCRQAAQPICDNRVRIDLARLSLGHTQSERGGAVSARFPPRLEEVQVCPLPLHFDICRPCGC